MNRLKAPALALLSSLLLVGAYPPIGLGFLAWVAVVPLLFLTDALPPRRAFLWAWLSGTVFYLATVAWMSYVTWPGMILAVIVLGMLHALPFFLVRLARDVFPRWWLMALPFLVAGLEWGRSFDPLAFPWMIYGNSQTAYPFLIQFADITSAFGVSWWVVMVNVAVFLLMRKRSPRHLAFAALLFLIPLGYSGAIISAAPENPETIRVALIQGNVGIDEKWDDDMTLWNTELYRSMSRKAAEDRPDLLVWPETAIPVYLLESPQYRYMVQSLADSTGIPILTGLPAIDLDTRETWNAAGLFLPGNYDVQRYRKIHLVPFGEAFPLDNVFPQLRNIDLGQANWDEGTERVVFTSPTLPPFHVAICFESIFPDLNRDFIRGGSRFITVITNDAWFGPRTAPIQHAMISVMRAIEFHRPIVRCANTGISMLIDPYGRIQARTGPFERTYLVGDITPRDDFTVYARFGNFFSLGCFLGSLLFIGTAVLKRRQITAGGV